MRLTMKIIYSVVSKLLMVLRTKLLPLFRACTHPHVQYICNIELKTNTKLNNRNSLCN